MKTSTKLLIAFFTGIPIVLVAHSWLLKKQYVAGKLTINYYDDRDDYNYTTLPRFKYLVINGAVTSGDLHNGGIGYRSFNTHAYVDIEPNAKKGQSVGILKTYQSLLNTRLSNDTLYIWLYRRAQIKQGDYWRFNQQLLRVYLDSTANNITTANGNFMLTSAAVHSYVPNNVISTLNGSNRISVSSQFTRQLNKHRLTLAIHNGTLNVNNLVTDTVNTLATDSATIYMAQNNFIKQYNYSLISKAHLTIEYGENIKSYNEVKVDPTTFMELNYRFTSSATYAKKYLHNGVLASIK